MANIISHIFKDGKKLYSNKVLKSIFNKYQISPDVIFDDYEFLYKIWALFRNNTKFISDFQRNYMVSFSAQRLHEVFCIIDYERPYKEVTQWLQLAYSKYKSNSDYFLYLDKSVLHIFSYRSMLLWEIEVESAMYTSVEFTMSFVNPKDGEDYTDALCRAHPYNWMRVATKKMLDYDPVINIVNDLN